MYPSLACKAHTKYTMGTKVPLYDFTGASCGVSAARLSESLPRKAMAGARRPRVVLKCAGVLNCAFHASCERDRPVLGHCSRKLAATLNTKQKNVCEAIAYFEPALLGFLFSQIQIGGDGALPCIITAGYLGSQLVWPVGIPAQ